MIYTAHGFHFFKGAPVKNWLMFYPAEWLLAPLTDVLVTINKEDYALAKRKIHAKRIEYVPGVGVDTAKFHVGTVDRAEKRRELGLTEQDFLILTVAEMTKNKNHSTVLKALALLKMKKKGNYNIVTIDPAYRPAPIEHKQVFGITFEQGRNEFVIDENLLNDIVTTNHDLPEDAKRDLIVALIVGIGLGRLAARKRDRAADAGIRTFAILCYATPVFFLGLILKLIFAIWLNVLPASGRSSLGSEMQFSRLVSPTGFYIIDAIQLGDMSVLLDVLRHAVLPALALGLLTAGVFIRLVRTNVIATYNSGYVEAARSRGVSEKRLLNKHAWKPALIPIITVMGMQIALMLAGAVLTETTFEWKGLGFMLSQYLKARDFVAVQGIVILIAIIVAVVNFIVDVIAALVDPRVRY